MLFLRIFQYNFNSNFRGKLQITTLNFGGNWILHPEVLEFEFYPLVFESVWILHPDVSEFGFYSLKFGSV